MRKLELCEENLLHLHEAIKEGGWGTGLVDWLEHDGWDRVPELMEPCDRETAEYVMFGLGYLQGIGEALDLTSLQVLEAAGWSEETAEYTNPDKHGGPVGEIEHDHDCIKRRVPAAACDCAEVQA